MSTTYSSLHINKCTYGYPNEINSGTKVVPFTSMKNHETIWTKRSWYSLKWTTADTNLQCIRSVRPTHPQQCRILTRFIFPYVSKVKYIQHHEGKDGRWRKEKIFHHQHEDDVYTTAELESVSYNKLFQLHVCQYAQLSQENNPTNI